MEEQRASAQPGMRRSQNARRERHGVRVTREVIEGSFGWDFTDTASPIEVGVDAYVEIVGTEHDDDLITGRVVALQIKDGESYLKATKTGDGWRFNEDDHHQAYWLGHSLPVIVVLVHPDGRAWWGHISTDAAIDYEKGFRLDIPLTNVLDAHAKAAWTEIAGTFRGVTDRLDELYSKLPSDAVGILKRAENVDRLAVARLAHRLVSGSVRAGDAVGLLLKRAPTWLADSPAVRDLWLAVAAFATEHDLEGDLPCGAFEAAAAAGPPGLQAARAQAFGGLTLLFTAQRDRAKRLLRAASDGGAVLLADFGLAALEVDPNTAPAFAIPASIAAATDQELDAEPTLLNFLGEMAKREGRITDGIALRRRAIDRPNPGSGVMLELAKELYQRALREGRAAGSDVREALELSQRAAVDRRGWSGPSAGAVEVIAQVLYMTGENRQVIAETTSLDNGGRALAHEAADPRVIRVGALAALASSDEEAWDRYLALLGPADGEVRSHLLALQASLDHDTPDAEAIAHWQTLADEARDDSHAASAVARLAHLGVWSARADDLIARSILPAAEVEMLRAVVLARTDPPTGIARLRDLARSRPMAALELVLAIESDPASGLEAALTESRLQFDRWRTWDLAEQQMSLLQRDDDLPGAWEVAFASVRDSNFSVGFRQRAARWLVKSLTAAGEHSRAADAAQAGLGLSDDEVDLAWMLVLAHYNSGNIPRARAAADRWQLRPATDQEIELWLILRQGSDLSPANAQILLSLIERLPASRFRDRVRALAIREILTPENDAIVYSTSVVDAANDLAQEAGVIPRASNTADDDKPADSLAHDDTDPNPKDPNPWRRPTPQDFARLVHQARSGLIPLSDLAIQCDRPYAATLIDNPAGVLVAADAGTGLRDAGSVAAARALAASEWVIDLSTVALLTHPVMPGLRDALGPTPRLLVSGRGVDDIVSTREQLRGVAYSRAITAGLGSRPELADPARVARVRQHARAMESLAESQTTVGGDRHHNDPLEASIVLAATRGVPLWCDDSAGRQRARKRGITTFSTVDLIETLKLSKRVELLRGLAGCSVLDLPLAPEDVIAIAKDTKWQLGPVHVAMASRGLWRNWGLDWVDAWREICAAASYDAISVDRMALLGAAALNGALADVSTSQERARYARMASIAIAQAYATTPDFDASGYLESLATHVSSPTVVPGPLALTTTLVIELADQGFAHPSAKATELLGRLTTS